MDANLTAGLIDKGVLGIFVLVLLYGISKLAQKADERITEDRKVFEAIRDKLDEGNKLLQDNNLLYKVLIEEHKNTREFFKEIVEHERKQSEDCYKTIHQTQLKKKEILIELQNSMRSFHKRLSAVEEGFKNG